MFIPDRFTFARKRCIFSLYQKIQRNPEIDGCPTLTPYVNQCSFASCSRCFSKLISQLRYVDEARAFFPAMPACHALPPAPAYHASRHAPFFFPPVRHDTSRPIITSPPHPAGDASIKKGFERVHPSGSRDLRRQALLPRDQTAISEITAVLPA